MRKATHADRSSDVDAPDDPNARKGKFRGKFRRVLKAVFFEASLRMSRSESFASMGQTESSEKFSRINSSDSSSSRSISSRTKQVLQQKLERGRYCWKVGCCCLILCLLALLFWGKALAIVFISAWLYFAPLYFKSAIDPPPLFEPSESCMITTRNRPRHARRHSGF
nr:uncharacterized protein LOC109188136 [Ipomoea batatas]GMC76603.1 uncharacterized protein LOC109188136 [Ipomoea batatas]GMC79134.1 uncharacterized protein LOC109188136 [Ipomoea batatas]GME18919.1 uncharacterized protein LOC109188136 [Ipomoea batatas]